MSEFVHTDFLLKTATARRLSHESAEGLPIIDCHNHLDPGRLLGAIKFDTIGTLVPGRRMGAFSPLQEFRACLKKGGTGNLPVPVGNLPTGTSVSITCQRVAPLCSERFPHSVGRVTQRDRLAACATPDRFFRQALK